MEIDSKGHSVNLKISASYESKKDGGQIKAGREYKNERNSKDDHIKSMLCWWDNPKRLILSKILNGDFNKK